MLLVEKINKAPSLCVFFKEKTLIKQLIYSIRQGLSNLKDWFPIIWNDRDFDYGYLLELVEFKSRRMLKFFESDKSSTDWEQEREQNDLLALRRFIPLIQYIHRQEYEDDAFEEWYKEFPSERKMNFEDVEISGEKYRISKPMDNKESERLRYWLKVSETNYENAMKKMGNILLNSLRNWWD
jgi:hypothetical protein